MCTGHAGPSYPSDPLHLLLGIQLQKLTGSNYCCPYPYSGTGPSTEAWATYQWLHRSPTPKWFSLPQYPSTTNEPSSGSSFPSMLEFWLAWPCGDLTQATTATGSSRERRPCYVGTALHKAPHILQLCCAFCSSFRDALSLGGGSVWRGCDRGPMQDWDFTVAYPQH